MKENNNLFEVIMWPEVKYFMQFTDDFLQNSVPIIETDLVKEYGAHAYLVRKSWMYSLNQEKIKFTYG